MRGEIIQSHGANMIFSDYIRIFLTFIMRDRIEAYEEKMVTYQATIEALDNSCWVLAGRSDSMAVELSEARARIVELEENIKVKNEKVEVLWERYHQVVLSMLDCGEYLANLKGELKDG